MGWNEDHIRSVAKRRAHKAQLYGEQWEKAQLKHFGWELADIRKIIEIEREILKHENRREET